MDTRETMFLFQRLSVALQGEMRSHSYKPPLPTQKCDHRCSRALCLQYFSLQAFAGGRK